MSLRRFVTRLAPSATGASIIQIADTHRGVDLKGLVATNGVTLSAGANDLTISGDNTGATVGGSTRKRVSTATTANASVTYANITGLTGFTLVAGTYSFRVVLPTSVASGVAGIKVAFNYTGGATLSAMQCTATAKTASAVTVSNVTSTTAQADLYSAAAQPIAIELEGVIVVSAGGNLDIQMAQNTSNASNSTVSLNGYASFTRIA